MVIITNSCWYIFWKTQPGSLNAIFQGREFSIATIQDIGEQKSTFIFWKYTIGTLWNWGVMFRFCKTHGLQNFGRKSHSASKIFEEVVSELIENVPFALYNAVYSQQDGTSNHNFAFLDNKIPASVTGTFNSFFHSWNMSACSRVSSGDWFSFTKFAKKTYDFFSRYLEN